MQVTGGCEGLVALLASVRFFPGVYPSVTTKVAGAHEGFRTIRTFMRLLSGVGEHVTLQVSQLRESSEANVALVRALPCANKKTA